MSGMSRRIVGAASFSILAAGVILVLNQWGDQRVSPKLVSSKFRVGQSADEIRALLPKGLPLDTFGNDIVSWKVSRAGLGQLFGAQPEIILEFDTRKRLFHAYYEIRVRGEEVTYAIPLQKR